MRRLSLALLATVAVIGSAAAADLPVKAPVYAPIVAPLYNWTGFYIGLNLGGSWGNQDAALIDYASGATIATSGTNVDGIVGGGQIGYNWQVNQWVFGLEADFQGSGQNGDGSFFIPGVIGATPSTSIAYTSKLDWFGTVRGRIGYAFDRWLPYVTGGWAYGHGEINGTTTAGGVATSFSGSQDYNGWTVGAGVEWAFLNNWSAKLEYLYIDFGDGPTVPVSATRDIASGRMTDNIVRVGVNYKF